MTKKRGILLGAITLSMVIASSPVFVSWIANRGLNGSQRAHYVYGLGRMASWLGSKQTESKLTHKAEMIYENRVELIIDFSSRDEMEAIFDQPPIRASWIEAGNIESTSIPDSLQVAYEVPSSISQEFQAAIEQAKIQYREAQQAAPD